MSRRFIGLIPGSGGGIDLGAAGNTTGTLATISSGTAVLAGGNNITLSQNGQNITISAGGGGTLSQIFAAPHGNLNWSVITDQFTGGTINVWPFDVLMPMSFSAAVHPCSISLSTSSNSSYSVNISIALGMYTRNGSTLSLASSGSQSYAFTITSNSSSASYTGNRMLSIPITISATPGNYWLAASSSTATTNTNWATVSNWVYSVSRFSPPAAMGAATNNSNQAIPGWGQMSVSSSALPTAIGFSDIRATANSMQEFPVFAMVNFTA